MEALPERTDGSPRVVPPSRQLTGGGNKVERFTQHTRELFSDLTSYVDLRIELVRAEIDEKVGEAKELAVLGGALALVGLLALVFLLLTIAIVVGDLLGHVGWGFFVVTLLLGFIAAGIGAKLKSKTSKGDQ